MDYFEINGRKQLHGEVEISGAKNAVLPLMAAAILNNKKLQIINVPYLSDSSTMAKLLESMGAKVAFDSHNSITVDSSSLDSPFASYDLVKTMRASFYVLGPLIAKFGYAKVSLPGGCAWGPRPVDFHLEGLKALGVDIQIENGYVIASAKEILGGKIHFPKISVGATGNVGRKIIEVLEKKNFSIHNLYLLASSKSAGSKLKFNNKEIEVENLETFDFSKAQITFFSSGGKISEKYLPNQAKH